MFERALTLSLYLSFLLLWPTDHISEPWMAFSRSTLSEAITSSYAISSPFCYYVIFARSETERSILCNSNSATRAVVLILPVLSRIRLSIGRLYLLWSIPLISAFSLRFTSLAWSLILIYETVDSATECVLTVLAVMTELIFFYLGIHHV